MINATTGQGQRNSLGRVNIPGQYQWSDEYDTGTAYNKPFDLFSLFDPGAILRMLQMTPQISAEEMEQGPLTQAQMNRTIGLINENGWFGTPGGFSQQDIDDAIWAQTHHGDSAPFRAISQAVQNKLTYQQSYGSPEKLLADLGSTTSALGQLITNLQGDIETPLYSEQDILGQTTRNTEDVMRSRDRNLEVGREGMAGRGILESGLTTDMVTQARETADEMIRKGQIDIPLTLNSANKQFKTSSEALLGDILDKKTAQESGLGLALGQLKEGKIPAFTPESLLGATDASRAQREMRRYFNASQTQGALKETKSDMQSMFDSIMSIWGMKQGSKSSGGSSGGSFSGNVGIPGLVGVGYG